MNKASYIIDFVKSRKELKKKNHDGGFSLIELVVAVGILAILSVVGVVAYSQITERAGRAAVDAAASEIYTAVTAAIVDGNDSTDPQTIKNDYEASFSSDNYAIDYRPANATRSYSITVTDLDTRYSSTHGGELLK